MIQRFAATNPAHKKSSATIRHISMAALKSVFLAAFFCASVRAQAVSHHIDEMLAAWKVRRGPGMAAMLIRDGKRGVSQGFWIGRSRRAQTHHP